jgi:hypothetical protein
VKRLPRYLFTVLSALSLPMCLAVCVLWVRGAVFHVSDAGSVCGKGCAAYLGSFGNTVTLSRSVNRRQAIDDPFEVDVDSRRIDPAWWAAREERLRPMVEHRRWGAFGFRLGIGHSSKFYPHNGRWIPVRVEVPHWASLIAGVSLTAVMRRGYWRTVRGEWLAAGRCSRCGYELRASPQRCPEFGTLTAKLANS